jgi:hypothetical protein
MIILATIRFRRVGLDIRAKDIRPQTEGRRRDTHAISGRTIRFSFGRSGDGNKPSHQRKNPSERDLRRSRVPRRSTAS